MGYVYAGMFLVAALILVFRLGRENKIFYFAGGLFFYMSLWWLADELLEVDLFHGTWGWVFRIVVAVALVIVGLAYFRERKKDAAREDGEDQ